MKIRPKRYIVWFKDEVDLDSPFQRKWYYQQVLTCGRSEDIRELNIHEIKQLLPEMSLPAPVKRMWEIYFMTNPF